MQKQLDDLKKQLEELKPMAEKVQRMDALLSNIDRLTRSHISKSFLENNSITMRGGIDFNGQVNFNSQVNLNTGITIPSSNIYSSPVDGNMYVINESGTRRLYVYIGTWYYVNLTSTT
jgi:hypothetical protein